jgi:hypothetical protein
MADNEQDLLDYEEDDEQTTNAVDGNQTTAAETKKGGYVSIHSSGFRDFLLKPELLRAIIDCGFEHPRYGTAGTDQSLDDCRRHFPLKMANRFITIDVHL